MQDFPARQWRLAGQMSNFGHNRRHKACPGPVPIAFGSVLLSTPVAVFGAVAVLWLPRAVLAAFLPAYMVQLENDVYMQIGLVMLIGPESTWSFVPQPHARKPGGTTEVSPLLSMTANVSPMPATGAAWTHNSMPSTRTAICFRRTDA